MRRLCGKLLLGLVFSVLTFTWMTPTDVYAQCGKPFVEGIVETMARQAHQLPQGVYDAYSNRTFVVYPGCSSLDVNVLCTADPYITYYDHGSDTWTGSMKVTDSPIKYDSHSYPQVVLDDQHYVHVFNGGHGHPIQHYKSAVRTDHDDILSIENWEEKPFSHTADQDKATYIMVFQSQDNAIYLLYRQTVQGPPDWYEPIYYIKSTDEGDTWSVPRKLIDPAGKDQSDGSCDNVAGDDEWDTIYIKGIYHPSDSDDLYITFENHKNHNSYEDKLFYVYFDLSTDTVYAPNGSDLGQCVNQNEFENPANKIEIYSSGEKEFSETASVVSVDADDQVNIFYTITENDDKLSINWVVWNGLDWDPPIYLFWDEPYDIRPIEIEFHDDNSFDLYTEQGEFDLSLLKLAVWHYNNNADDPQWSKTVIQSNTEQDGYSDFAFIRNHHSHVKATYIEGEYTIWHHPLPTGKMYAWGIRDEYVLFSAGGQVTDVYGTPFSGVTVSANTGVTAITDATGHFTFTDFGMGTYVLTPTLNGYAFYPPTRTVILPPDDAAQDFTILPGPVSTTLTFDVGTVSLPASLPYTDTQGLVTYLDFPAGAVSYPTELTLRPTLASGETGFAFAGHAFELVAYQQGSVHLDFTFAVPVTVTIRYGDGPPSPISDESRLSLRWWTGDGWQDAAGTCNPASSYTRDLEGNVLSVPICRTGRFSLFGPTNQVFLPLTLHNYDVQRLTHHLADDTQPALSPDGQTVVFISDRDGRPDIFRIPAAGGPAVNLTQTDCADEGTPGFSPDGSTIAFASNQTGDWDIYLMDVDSAKVRVVVESAGTDEVHPSLTPDGRRLVFASNRVDGNWDVYTTTIDYATTTIVGRAWSRLTDQPAADRFPTYSTDGTIITFRSERDGNSEIYLMKADGSDLHRLTDNPAFDGYPTLTPDGSGVVFVSTRSGERSVYVANLAGEGTTALEQRSGWRTDTPRLSSDGRLLVYAGGATGHTSDIYKRGFSSPLLAIGRQGAANMAEHCDWEGGVLAYGWIHAWQATRDSRYRQWVREWVDVCVATKTEITHVNDGLLGYAALFAYEESGQSEYLVFAQQVADYLVGTAPRTADATLTHDDGRVWVDTLIGSVPFLVEMSQVVGDDAYVEEAITQVVKHAVHLQDPDSGLYHHAWDESQSNPAGQAYWGRGNGWALLADATVLSVMTTAHPLRSTVQDIAQRQAAALRPLQDPGGLWHTVVTRPDFYLETSGSAMIGYVFRRGVRQGWLDGTYTTSAWAAKLGVWRQVLADGTVTNVSAPTWPMQTEEEYDDRSYDALQLYGQGLVLLLESPVAHAGTVLR
jgi:unsaturated rhamnogalacturonyl hydrolase